MKRDDTQEELPRDYDQIIPVKDKQKDKGEA